MRTAKIAWATGVILLLAGCQAIDETADEEPTGKATVKVLVPIEGIPANGECAHIVATRLADFESTEYMGPLGGATFMANEGENRITATAYPMPCTPEPSAPPWIATEQIVNLVAGANTINLMFVPNAEIVVDPNFWDDVDPELTVRGGSAIRSGRNFEDAAGPNYAIDGWDVMQISLPLIGGGGTPSTTMLFSTQTAGVIPYTPRGMARLADGRWVFQVGESTQPLWVFTGGGVYVESWPVVLDPGMLQFDSTDGLERVDATHLVRTAFLNAPLNCPEFEGPSCIQSAIEILELRSGPSGNFLAVSQQILLPFPYNTLYPVGVTAAANGRYVVSILPGTDSQFISIDATGALLAGPENVAGDNEGLFVNGTGTRLGALTYEGMLTMHVSGTLTPRAGEVLNYTSGVQVSNPYGLAWHPASGRFVALYGTSQLAFVNDTFTTRSPLAIDTSGYLFVGGVEVDSDSNQLLLLDRFPPIDPGTGLRTATVDIYDLTTLTLVDSIQLNGVPTEGRTRTLAYIGGGQVASHHRRAGGVVDPNLDATIFINNLADGSLASVINLSPWGVHRILSLNFMPATGEIALLGTDVNGVVRLMVVSISGTPDRSYRTDTIEFVSEMAPITSGPFAGDLGVVIGQPSTFLRIAPP
jgi:hypothetical protein